MLEVFRSVGLFSTVYTCTILSEASMPGCLCTQITDSFGLIKIDFLSPTGRRDAMMTDIPGVKR